MAKYTLVPLRDEELRKAGVPLSCKTLYKWHAQQKYPELFVKLGRKLFLVRESFDKLIEKQLRRQSYQKRT